MSDGKYCGRLPDDFYFLLPNTKSYDFDIMNVQGIFDKKTNRIFPPIMASLIHLGAYDV